MSVDATWLAISVAAGFPARPEAVFHTLVDAITLALVFVIQHTASRDQAATHRKLDEILQALPNAEKSLIALEEAGDEELRRAAQRHHHARRRAHAQRAEQRRPSRASAAPLPRPASAADNQ